MEGGQRGSSVPDSFLAGMMIPFFIHFHQVFTVEATNQLDVMFSALDGFKMDEKLSAPFPLKVELGSTISDVCQCL